ncbi:hypothetical protein PR048_000562 [Dryococelus australis]|uniref:Uncharacterized protein n=1 Tax=Dryococelus australis TaxID=614101 RepID=A0ABQ9IFK5_9NEOP|nr:hypothetical protein PR048_000562 [Dryococelus australis]
MSLPIKTLEGCSIRQSVSGKPTRQPASQPIKNLSQQVVGSQTQGRSPEPRATNQRMDTPTSNLNCSVFNRKPTLMRRTDARPVDPRPFPSRRGGRDVRAARTPIVCGRACWVIRPHTGAAMQARREAVFTRTCYLVVGFGDVQSGPRVLSPPEEFYSVLECSAQLAPLRLKWEPRQAALQWKVALYDMAIYRSRNNIREISQLRGGPTIFNALRKRFTAPLPIWSTCIGTILKSGYRTAAAEIVERYREQLSRSLRRARYSLDGVGFTLVFTRGESCRVPASCSSYGPLALVSWFTGFHERLHPSHTPYIHFIFECAPRCCGGEVVRLLASHPGELGSIPGKVARGFSYVGIVLDDAAGRRAFSGISRFSRLIWQPTHQLAAQPIVNLPQHAVVSNEAQDPFPDPREANQRKGTSTSKRPPHNAVSVYCLLCGHVSDHPPAFHYVKPRSIPCRVNPILPHVGNVADVDIGGEPSRDAPILPQQGIHIDEANNRRSWELVGRKLVGPVEPVPPRARKRDWGRIVKESAMAVVSDPSEHSPGFGSPPQHVRVLGVTTAARVPFRQVPTARRPWPDYSPPTLGEPGSIPGVVAPKFSHVGITPDDAAGRRIFLVIFRFPPPLHSGAAAILISLNPHRLSRSRLPRLPKAYVGKILQRRTLISVWYPLPSRAANQRTDARTSKEPPYSFISVHCLLCASTAAKGASCTSALQISIGHKRQTYRCGVQVALATAGETQPARDHSLLLRRRKCLPRAASPGAGRLRFLLRGATSASVFDTAVSVSCGRREIMSPCLTIRAGRRPKLRRVDVCQVRLLPLIGGLTPRHVAGARDRLQNTRDSLSSVQRLFTANRSHSSVGSLPKSCGTMPLVGGFLGKLPFLPPLNSGAAPYSPQSPIIGSQDLDVKSHRVVSWRGQRRGPRCRGTERLSNTDVKQVPMPRTPVAHANKMASLVNNHALTPFADQRLVNLLDSGQLKRRAREVSRHACCCDGTGLTRPGRCNRHVQRAGDCIRFALLGGEHANRSATAAPTGVGEREIPQEDLPTIDNVCYVFRMRKFYYVAGGSQSTSTVIVFSVDKTNRTKVSANAETNAIDIAVVENMGNSL